jgi:hypothetical protein
MSSCQGHGDDQASGTIRSRSASVLKNNKTACGVRPLRVNSRNQATTTLTSQTVFPPLKAALDPLDKQRGGLPGSEQVVDPAMPPRVPVLKGHESEENTGQ